MFCCFVEQRTSGNQHWTAKHAKPWKQCIIVSISMYRLFIYPFQVTTMILYKEFKQTYHKFFTTNHELIIRIIISNLITHFRSILNLNIKNSIKKMTTEIYINRWTFLIFVFYSLYYYRLKQRSNLFYFKLISSFTCITLCMLVKPFRNQKPDRSQLLEALIDVQTHLRFGAYLFRLHSDFKHSRCPVNFVPWASALIASILDGNYNA